MDEMLPPRVCLELGRDHGRYGSFACGAPGGGVAWAISVGADAHSPSLRFKGNRDEPNEDALLVADGDARCLLAVADAHFGAEASHDLLHGLARQLADGGRPIPAGARELDDLIRALGPRRLADYASESTLLVAVFERQTRRGFGVGFGDSSLAVIGAGGVWVAEHPADLSFVSPADPGGLDPDAGTRFGFEARPGELVMVYTDGIDGCHYNHPETSVTPAQMQELFASRGPAAEGFVRALVELALEGVGGYPGGQDNIAVAAVST